jgi:hypothetical protein
METTHGKTHSENGEGECWWSDETNATFLFQKPWAYARLDVSVGATPSGCIFGSYSYLE